MKKFTTFLFIVIGVMAISLQSCSKDDDNEVNNSSFGNEKEPAPEQLPVGYVIAKNRDAYPVFFWIKNETQGWHNDSRNTITNRPNYTRYSYRKTSSNTAFFSFSITQQINGPIRNRLFNYEGTLTFKSPNNFSYEGTYEYYADGVYQKDYKFSEPSLTFVPEDKYKFIATMP